MNKWYKETSYIPVQGGNIVSVGNKIYVVNSMSNGLPAYDQYLDTETNKWYTMDFYKPVTNLYGASAIEIDGIIYVLSNYDPQVISLDTNQTQSHYWKPGWKVRPELSQPIYPNGMWSSIQPNLPIPSFLSTPVLVVDKVVYKFGYGRVSYLDTNQKKPWKWLAWDLLWVNPDADQGPCNSDVNCNNGRCIQNVCNWKFTGVQYKLAYSQNKIYIMGRLLFTSFQRKRGNRIYSIVYGLEIFPTCLFFKYYRYG